MEKVQASKLDGAGGVCSPSEQFQAGYAGPGSPPGRRSTPAEARLIWGQAWKSKWA